jgi:hypothetical protein
MTKTETLAAVGVAAVVAYYLWGKSSPAGPAAVAAAPLTSTTQGGTAANLATAQIDPGAMYGVVV